MAIGFFTWRTALPPVARALRPHVYEWRTGTAHWRGALITSLSGSEASVRVFPEASFGRTFVGPLEDVPVGARTLGAPVCVRVSGSTAATWTLQEIRESHFERGAPSAPAAILDGQFYGVVPRSVTQQSEYLDWDAADAQNATREQTDVGDVVPDAMGRGPLMPR